MKIVAISLLAAILAGCGIGPITTTTQEATQGQQLLDLKKAYDQGILSDEEYQRERSEILSN